MLFGYLGLSRCKYGAIASGEINLREGACSVDFRAGELDHALVLREFRLDERAELRG
jgi:hypothetical protein